MMRLPSFAPILAAATFLLLPMAACGQAELVSNTERASFHRDPQWRLLEPHLPNPQTATAAQLETAADVLRARRFPQDALDYYGYAIARGGNIGELFNKMGVIRLELRQPDIAKELFLRTVRANKKNSVAWNNLGVTEYSQGQYRTAITDYHRASRLDTKSAVFHSNLAMAYFESGDMESARVEFTTALRLDPQAFDTRDGSGTSMHVVGTQNFPKLAFEMARIYAARHQDAATVLWLSKATEAGFDTRSEMAADVNLRPYIHDPRIVTMMRNVKQMRERSVASALPAQSLGPASGTPNFD